jgi:transposase InsO family protein
LSKCRSFVADQLQSHRADSAGRFFRKALDWSAQHSVPVEAVLTANGSHGFADFCRSRRIKHVRIKPRRPQTNGKVERLIQTLLRGWACRFSYNSSTERRHSLAPYLHFHNFHLAHSALSYNAPISRLVRNNVLTRNS